MGYPTDGLDVASLGPVHPGQMHRPGHVWHLLNRLALERLSPYTSELNPMGYLLTHLNLHELGNLLVHHNSIGG